MKINVMRPVTVKRLCILVQSIADLLLEIAAASLIGRTYFMHWVHAIQTYFMHWVVCATNQSELSLTERQVLVKIVLRFTFFNEDWLLLKSVACLVTVKRRRYRFLMSALETRSHTNVPQARIFCCFVETSVVQMMLFCLCSHFFSGAARYLRF